MAKPKPTTPKPCPCWAVFVTEPWPLDDIDQRRDDIAQGKAARDG